MKILKLAAIWMLPFLTACAAHTPKAQPPNLEVFLQPTVIEGPYKSMVELMLDPKAGTQAVFDFARSAEAAKDVCNADKAGAWSAVKP